MSRRTLAILIGVAAIAGAAVARAETLEIDGPSVAPVGTPVTIVVSGAPGSAPATVEVLDPTGTVVASGRMQPGEPMRLEFPASRGLTVQVGAERVPVPTRPIPGWITLLPPLLAIGLALALRQVLLALVAGVWAGAWIVYGSPFTGALRTLDRYLVNSLADADHVMIVMFSLLLGGMVGIISRSGGTVGLVEAIAPLATTRRRGQFVTWLMGLAIFFDDYANTLLVGNTMRPVTDRLRISREKLAYIVDSTAAPVAAIALVSTWIGYEVSLIGDSLEQMGSDLDGYIVFLRAVPYNFYPILALVFGLMVATGRRDFGPMLAAERRAARGRVLSDAAAPLSDFDSDALRPVEGRPHRWINAAIPILTVLVATFAGLWLTGRASLVADGDPLGTSSVWALGIQGLGSVFGAGESYKTLLWSAAAGCVVALVLARAQGILSLTESITAWINGIRSMILAIAILMLAWSISAVCADLGTSAFLVASIADLIDPRWLPCIIFVLAALTAFATGTSWTTMGILIPLAVPAAHGVAASAGMAEAAATSVLLASVSAVLAGAIFGDHCSPISDTTVMSSMASGCDHVDHVRTQLPYALLVGGVAAVLGYIPSGFGVPNWICLLVASAVLFGVVRWIGRTSPLPEIRI